MPQKVNGKLGKPLLDPPAQIDDNDDEVGKDWVIVEGEEIQRDRAWFERNRVPDDGHTNGGKTLRGHYHIDVGWGRWKTRLYEVDWTISGEHPHNCGCSRRGGIQEGEDEGEYDDGDCDGDQDEDGQEERGINEAEVVPKQRTHQAAEPQAKQTTFGRNQ
ncbi:hypothetical protein PT974_11078 [Cladobotryum mycophilum]|uniref:Uncharacterized protein n=1 Tax=Cladobotryum mycophilum TaxID=491253 RepID=A0ABR0SCH6_9HYPO